MLKLGGKRDKRAFDLYREYSRTQGNDITSEFAQLTDYAVSYREITDNNNPDLETARWMRFYDDLKITNFHPFLLFIVKHKELSSDERNQVFAILESYIVRWMLCYGDNEDRINEYRYARIDAFFSKVIKEGKFSVKEFVVFLSDSNNSPNAWPTNEQVKDALQGAGAKDVNAHLIVYILYRIELLKRDTPLKDAGVQLRFKDFGNREHIMPRKWSNHWPLPVNIGEPLHHWELYSPEYRAKEPEWREKRGQKEHLFMPDAPAYQEAYIRAENRHDEIDSIGNITPLSRELNSDLSDLSFDEKKAILLQNTTVNLQLTKEILEHDSWAVEQIRKRAQNLYKCFCKVWRPAEYFLKSKSDKMIESEAHVFITDAGERNLVRIEVARGKVTGV